MNVESSYFNLYTNIMLHMTVTVAERSKSYTVFARSKAGIVGSNPTQGMDVCVQVEALRRADHPPKESYRMSKM
jgi:hypothetical protein